LLMTVWLLAECLVSHERNEKHKGYTFLKDSIVSQ